MKYLPIKRVLDVLLAIFGILVTLPVFIVVAFCIKLDSKGPVIFFQPRLGKDAKAFTLYKFRTMEAITEGDAAKDQRFEPGSRVTRIGKVLRKTSIDELPQLINVIKGEMSLVGPRPVVLAEEELIQLRIQNGVYAVRPGITGWAQINGRDRLSIKEKVRLDREYIDRMGLLFDLGCMFKTIVYVLKCKDIKETESIAGHITHSQSYDKLVYIGATEKPK